MASFNAGLSGLMAAKYAIEICGQNISNVNTPGYSRQRVTLAPALSNTTPIGMVGTGVEAKNILAIRDALVESRLLAQGSNVGYAEVMSRSSVEMEVMLNGAGSGNLHDVINEFFTAVNELANMPDDSVGRNLLLTAGGKLAENIRSLSERIGSFTDNIDDELDIQTKAVNGLLERIAQFNGDIHQVSASGKVPNNLIDARDETVRELSKLINVQIVPSDFHMVNILHEGHMLVTSDKAIALEAGYDSTTDDAYVGIVNGVQIKVGGGEIGALLEMRNEWVPEYVGRFEELTASIIREVNSVHSKGVGHTGYWESWISTNPVSDKNGDGDPANDVLAYADLPFEMSEGRVYFNITDLATGEVVDQAYIEINPVIHTLDDLVTAIDGLPHLTASSRGGNLSILSETGYGFDCTGRLDSHPEPLGGAIVTVSGEYNGTQNDMYTFTSVGTGTVGSGVLQVNVTDANGTLIANLDVGGAYTPGEALILPGGVSVSFDDSGGFTNGDVTTLHLVADSDTAGLLPALGLNCFFTGSGEDDIAVREELLENFDLLAAGLTDAAGDNQNLLRLIELQDEEIVGESQLTFNGAFQSIVSDVAIDVSHSETVEYNQGLMLQQLQNQRESVSGVSLDEEVAKLMQFQHAYEASARYLSTAMQMMQILVDL